MRLERVNAYFLLLFFFFVTTTRRHKIYRTTHSYYEDNDDDSTTRLTVTIKTRNVITRIIIILVNESVSPPAKARSRLGVQHADASKSRSLATVRGSAFALDVVVVLVVVEREGRERIDEGGGAREGERQQDVLGGGNLSESDSNGQRGGFAEEVDRPIQVLREVRIAQGEEKRAKRGRRRRRHQYYYHHHHEQ